MRHLLIVSEYMGEQHSPAGIVVNRYVESLSRYSDCIVDVVTLRLRTFPNQFAVWFASLRFEHGIPIVWRIGVIRIFSAILAGIGWNAVSVKVSRSDYECRINESDR